MYNLELKSHSVAQPVALLLCSLLARIMEKQPIRRFYWPGNAFDWPEPA